LLREVFGASEHRFDAALATVETVDADLETLPVDEE
jgi:hypothetical protein